MENTTSSSKLNNIKNVGNSGQSIDTRNIESFDAAMFVDCWVITKMYHEHFQFDVHKIENTNISL